MRRYVTQGQEERIMRRNELKATRLAAGLSQSQAALMIGASVRTWQEWEQGRRNMPDAKWALFKIMIGERNA